MQNRRDFLKNTGALALGGMLLPNLADAFGHKITPKNFGVQLFTTMSIIDKDVTGTLKQIADIGYKEIESAFSMKGGYYGMKPKEFAKVVSDLGMTWQAHHIMGAPFRMPAPKPGAAANPNAEMLNKMPPMKSLMNDTQQVVDEVAEGGAKYLVCASIPVKTSEDIKSSLEILQKAGEACKKAGLTFVFHNHTAEFEKVDGQLPFDIFTSQISADLLKFELDLAWATKAGVNIPALFAKHPGRFPLFHVKDLNKETLLPVEVGTGIVDFKAIFAAADTAGVKHLFVEQDGAPSPINNLGTSFGNLKKIIS
ncbi:MULTISPECIES: sugar phosphate isomerase/epimerase [unclassified Arcicella]|uniref:sugar phosphate isomerase/epimerase family protein n=1 Tax=unclassified Arcicella TaxID=2644986 RepID=UPI002866D0B5|nr:MULTISPECIES: sugar phosphate isomerase/epimerase [unclassified Arcicella]MDR6561436.1 sugar phosphate isomerase/epimerase [Arcicella sp. BE51]MDR6811320.1 sugar phosphate isomerase/epimerase [Arcicella sp. BE140]MDR6822670.1 sugar phosphate isomerase/epimerase [Arcicella sp. BE139]